MNENKPIELLNKIPPELKNRFKNTEDIELDIRKICTLLSELWKKLKTIIQSVVEKIISEYKKLDKWQREKILIPNNKRKRRKIPMVRRRAYLRNIGNIKINKRE